MSDNLQNIREIHNAGLNVFHVIHRHGKDEQMSFKMEVSLIDTYSGGTSLLYIG